MRLRFLDDEREGYEHAPYANQQLSRSLAKLDLQKKKKTAADKSAKLGTFSGRMKAIALNGRFVGGIRERTVRFANVSSANIKKAQIRIVQPKPTSGIR